MSSLEPRIPPDAVWVTGAALMWLASRATPAIAVPDSLRVGIAAVLIVVGTLLVPLILWWVPFRPLNQWLRAEG